jgi:hypothetical protein
VIERLGHVLSYSFVPDRTFHRSRNR